MCCSFVEGGDSFELPPPAGENTLAAPPLGSLELFEVYGLSPHIYSKATLKKLLKLYCKVNSNISIV